jgi:formiminotetrahydrofolate cyclodeaminase
MKLVEMKINDYMELLASSAPAPGGGSASALSGAQGAGLTAMVAALTIGKKKYVDDQPLCEKVEAEAVALTKKFLKQVDEDTEAFNLVSAAFKLPKETDEEKALRSAEIAKATLVATKVPFATMELALDGLKLTESLVGHSNVNCASDLGVAALNLTACMKGAWLNVLINLSGLSDEDTVKDFTIKGKDMLSKADKLEKEILDGIGLNA